MASVRVDGGQDGVVIRRLWVDVAVGAVLALGIALIVLAGTSDRLPAALAGLAVLAVAYLVGRPALATKQVRSFVVFLVLAAVSIALMTWAEPALATMQSIVYPLVWMFAPRRPAGVGGSIVIGAGMFAGYATGLGLTPAIIRESTVIAALSVGFSIVIGWWFTEIANYGAERARLVAELTRTQQQVEALSREKGAADEREHLAREIHDTLAQTLAGLVILSEQAARRSRGGDVVAAAEAVEHLEAVARDALDETRAIVARTAAVPGDQALEAAVERLVARFRVDTGLVITLTVPPPGEPVDRDAQVVVLRCLQEGLANVRKHSGAVHVAATVERRPGGIRLVVADDGQGFDTAATPLGYGLDGMRDRVALAGGSVQLTSSEGRGTTLTVDLPAHAPRTEGAA